MNKQNYTDVNSKTWDEWAKNGCEWSKPISHEEYIKAKSGEWGVYLTPCKFVPKEWFGNSYVLEPLIDLLRIIYTPANTDYYLIHISHHISKENLQKLEYFAQLSSLEDIAERIPQAEKWFDELLERLEMK